MSTSLAEQTEWLRQQLETGPKLARDLAVAAGYSSPGGLSSASTALGVERRKVEVAGRLATEWRLPDHPAVPNHMPERDLAGELIELLDVTLDAAQHQDLPPMLVVAIPLEGEMVARQNAYDCRAAFRDNADWQRFWRTALPREQEILMQVELAYSEGAA